MPEGLTFRQKLIGGAVLAGLGAKFYILHRILAARRGRDPMTYHNGPGFAHLPRSKQMQVIYSKRQQLRNFESTVYGPGMSHAVRRPAMHFRPLHFGRTRRLF